ncbi:MAG: amidohydrolase family protein, partial [Proteobacteria bacterium]|nr:amidohydrolase family protein [Pseudomonadota bacterium]
MAADLVLCNLKTTGLAPKSAAPDLIAIQGNRIIFIGEKNALSELADAKTRVLDCQGGLVLPGFNDAHCHPLAFAITQRYLDCSSKEISCIGDIQAALRKHAEAATQDRWLRGAQLDAATVAERRLPNRWELDQAVPGLPVVLVERSGQHCVLNSLALARCGINDSTTDAGTDWLGRDPVSG